MLLIIVLGQIVTSAIVSGECDYGSMKLTDFDWNKYADNQPWYILLHTSNDFENKFEYFEVTFSSPVGKKSTMTVDVYDKSEQRNKEFFGYVTNWNSTGYYDINCTVRMWNGRVYVKAVDYERYAIGKLCSFYLNKTYDYVVFRSQHPDEATLKEVLKELQENNIDDSQFVVSSADHCQ